MTRIATLARTSAVVGVMCGVFALSTGCTPSATAGGTVQPGGNGPRDGAEPIGIQEGDSVPELEQRLERLTGEQAVLTDDAMVEGQACHDLCSLSVSICEVEVKLCDIADRQPQEGSYQALCREAQQECEAAQSSCEDCVGEHAGDSDEAPVTEPEE